MRLVAKVITLSAILFQNWLPGAGAITNRDKVRRDKEKDCSAVIYGDEIEHVDYIKLNLSGTIDIFGGGGGAATSAFLQEKLKDQARAVGLDVVRKLIVDGDSMPLGNGELTGGVLSYNHKGWSYKCCTWGCKWLVCSCCCKRCGKHTWPLPNTHQPHLCWKLRDSNALLQLPNKTAVAYHADCDTVDKVRSPACVAAFHRFCESEGFNAGFASDWGSDHFGVTCVHPAAYNTIKVIELAKFNPGCSLLPQACGA
eukprot:TRINITY_DN28853_c0_g1_i1.p1 TRINITY_DN28853_c0_g1~~TRINITY_DN28853_c0_g1_i1.p1  ORF type:complete len:255 (+),score=18.58 TRINITY_DN28853_c0_g1_i1:66-830(+)